MNGDYEKKNGSFQKMFEWDVRLYDRYLSYVSEMTDEILAWLDPKSHESILDIGCGDGRLTMRLAEKCALVEGIDSDANMIAAASRRGLNVKRQDARDLNVQSKYNAVFSNATFHWIKEPREVLRRCYRALKPGGRIVVEQGGEANLASLRAAIRLSLHVRGYDPRKADIWDLPTAVEQVERLEKEGFRVKRIETVYRPTRIHAEFSDWFAAFEMLWLGSIPQNDRLSIRCDVKKALENVVINERGEWTADYVRLRYIGVKD